MSLSLAQSESALIERRRAARVDAPQRLDLIRVLDVVIGGLALIFCAPVMVLIALAIWTVDGGAPFFQQTRIGRNGRRFRCWKFRSMVIDAEARLIQLLAWDETARTEWAADQKLRRDPRVTVLGAFLRATSLDELPQLINVLRGEMSLVGPRPIVESEIKRYGRWFVDYCAVRPGITGLWQVSGRNDVTYRRRVALDVLFVRRQSVGQYLSIIAATTPAVLRRHGSY
jgi:lipopolysaccharide/colanic/teichoic acid biosynthesis glycosyltransferase